MTGQRALLVFFAGCVLAASMSPGIGGSAVVHAQESSTASDSSTATERARSLFAEGVSLSDAGRWTLAAQRFREALALRNAPAIRYNLGSALIELGEFQEADTLLKSVVTDDESAEPLRRSATQARGDVRARAAELRFTEPGVTRVDGRFLPADFIDKPLFLVPGQHVIEHVARGRVIEQRVVELEAASITTVRWSEATWEARRQPANRLSPHVDDGDEDDAPLAPIVFSPLGPLNDAAEPAQLGTVIAVGFTVALVATVGAVAAATSDGGVPAGDLGPQLNGPIGVQILDF